MKKSLIALVISLCCITTACDWFGGNGDPIISPSPEIFKATVVPSVVEYNDSAVISLEYQYVTRFTVDGVESHPPFKIKNLTTSKTVTIIAYGEKGTTPVSLPVPITVSATKYTMAAHGWKLKSEEKWRISTNTRISWFELSETDLSEVKFYTLDGYINYIHSDGTIPNYSGWKYTLVGKIITSGDQVFTITLLNNSNFDYEQLYKYADDQVIKYFYEAAH